MYICSDISCRFHIRNMSIGIVRYKQVWYLPATYRISIIQILLLWNIPHTAKEVYTETNQVRPTRLHFNTLLSPVLDFWINSLWSTLHTLLFLRSASIGRFAVLGRPIAGARGVALKQILQHPFWMTCSDWQSCSIADDISVVYMWKNWTVVEL